MEIVHDQAEKLSPLAFLRTLQSSRNRINELVEDLKQDGCWRKQYKGENLIDWAGIFCFG